VPPAAASARATSLKRLAANPDRQRLLESGVTGDFALTAKIHEARKAYRRELRRELHGKKLTMQGKHCREALVATEHYKDSDDRQLMAPSGPRAARVGIGTICPATGPEERAVQLRDSQESGAWGLWTKPDERRHPIQPSARNNRFLGKSAEMCPREPGKGHLRSLKALPLDDQALRSSSQLGQFWSHHSDQWWVSHSHDSHVDLDSGEGDGGQDDGHGGVVSVGGVPHWHAYPELFDHEPSAATARRVEAHHREMLTSGITGSFVSARGARPTQAVGAPPSV